MTRRRVLALLSFGTALGTAPRAGAADEKTDDRAEGRRRFEAGETHFGRGAYAEALGEYEAGYRLTRLPGFLVNIAQCHRLMGDLRKARAHYRTYLLIEPASPRRKEIEEIVAALDRAIAARSPGEGQGPRKPRTPSSRWWLWSALAASIVGSTVATNALAASEARQGDE